MRLSIGSRRAGRVASVLAGSLLLLTAVAAPSAAGDTFMPGLSPTPDRLRLIGPGGTPTPSAAVGAIPGQAPAVTGVLAPLPPVAAFPAPPVAPPPAPVVASPPPVRWVYMVGTALPDSLRSHADQIDVLSPAWFHSDANGMIYGSDSPQVTQFAKDHGIKVVPIVANGEFSASVGHALVSDGNRQTQLLDSLQWLVSTYGYDGVNIDFENMVASDRTSLDAMMTNVYARLHPLGKLVTMAIGSKTSETYGGFSGVFDYAGLAPNLDFAVIMAYDQHYAGGPAGPVADVAWVNDVLTYAKSLIPPNKLLLGIPFYGYNWNISGGGSARAMSYTDIVSTVFAFGAQIQMSQAAQSPTFLYSAGNGLHQVWFENSDSLKAKLFLIDVHHLGGWAGWRLGQEDPNFWSLTLPPNPITTSPSSPLALRSS